MRSPVLAAFRSAQKVATGVDNTSAHGHALTRRTSANWNQLLGLLTLIRKGINATPAATITTAALKTGKYDEEVFDDSS